MRSHSLLTRGSGILGCGLLLLLQVELTQASSAYKNITISVPADTPPQEVGDALCLPASWIDIIVFLLGNYLAHVATIVTPSGSPTWAILIHRVTGFISPSFGLVIATDNVVSLARLEKDPVKRAVKSGAFLQVKRRSSWRPQAGDSIKATVISRLADDSKATIQPRVLTLLLEGYTRTDVRSIFDFAAEDCKTFGNMDLPDGYELGPILRTNQVSLDTESGEMESLQQCAVQSMEAAGSGLLKAGIAIFQIIYAAVSLYQVRGSQLKRYGYAAYSFTVIPYLYMSVVNLLAGLCTPEFPYAYVVRSSILDEAERHGGVFKGTVGRLVEDSDVAKDTTFDAQPSDLGILDFYQPSAENPELKARLRNLNASIGTGEEFCFAPPGSPSAEASQDVVQVPLYLRGIIDTTLASKRSRFLAWIEHPDRSDMLFAMHLCLLVGISALVIGLTSHFRPEQSSVAERVFVLGWIFSNGLLMYGFCDSIPLINNSKLLRRIALQLGEILILVVTPAFAIGGVVITIIELTQSGNCISL